LQDEIGDIDSIGITLARLMQAKACSL
jgi:hypothetical protein